MPDYRTETRLERQYLLRDIFTRIAAYLNTHGSEPCHIIVGTDSQVHAQTTRFVIGVVILSSTKQMWTGTHRLTKPYKIHSIYERLLYETLLTEDVLTALRVNVGKKPNITFEAHLDISGENQFYSARYAKELSERLLRIGFSARLKPYAYVASHYANRYTK
ncbi:ribonuclease H-like YkuK family protein [Shouchella miscanthi]|uniref:ribonuclease H-like YkuK family protein n=1 Tax=Shouchella miscanthi TaxID=2598861 RepID=UPI0011A0FBCA|nr:ribonuclease H-like YkuK family protein [Shouchella miscanthi]